MKKFNIFIVAGFFLIIISQSSFGATPGEIYEKYHREIVQQEINIFEGNIFFIVHSKVKKNIPSNLLFRKMKIMALKKIRPRFLSYKYPNVNKLWFELYYSLPTNSKVSIKKSFVVDRNVTADQAYLVLTVPLDQVSSSDIDIQNIKDTVNRAFDNKNLINLVKYSRVVKGRRLKEVQKEIALRSKVRFQKEKNTDVHMTEEIDEIRKPEHSTQKLDLLVNKNESDNILEKNNIDTQFNKDDEVLNNLKEKVVIEDEIRKPIECSLPLCKKMKTKGLNKDSAEKSINRKQLDKPFEGTKIQQSNELDDLL
jgi:hypothetical protein